MRIRPVEPRDYEQIVALQKRYPQMWDAPDNDVRVDFDSPDNLMCLVAEEDDGSFIAAVGAIHRYEVWMTMDRKAFGPMVYLRVLQKLFVKIIWEMYQAGFNAGYATVPKQLKSWSNMLAKRFGFHRVDDADLFWFNAKREIERVQKAS